MDHALVRIILKGAISSPADVDLRELDQAIYWVEDRINLRRPDKGTDQVIHDPHLADAAGEMRTLRRLLAKGDVAGATESAQRALASFNS